jgi:acylphosphatase
MTADIKSLRAVIVGRVQGVWFRGWTEKQARERGLNGWVRNRADGTVEAVFSGPARQVDDMLEACRKGPPAARVESIETFPEDAPSEPGFSQIRR